MCSTSTISSAIVRLLFFRPIFSLALRECGKGGDGGQATRRRCDEVSQHVWVWMGMCLAHRSGGTMEYVVAICGDG